MNESVETTAVGMCMENEIAPMPSVIPGEFIVCLGEGWGSSLHDLANGLAEWEFGVEAAVEMMLTLLAFVEIELKDFDDMVEQPHLLRGALVTAGIEAAGVGRGGNPDC